MAVVSGLTSPVFLAWYYAKKGDKVLGQKNC